MAAVAMLGRGYRVECRGQRETYLLDALVKNSRHVGRGRAGAGLHLHRHLLLLGRRAALLLVAVVGSGAAHGGAGSGGTTSTGVAGTGRRRATARVRAASLSGLSDSASGGCHGCVRNEVRPQTPGSSADGGSRWLQPGDAPSFEAKPIVWGAVCREERREEGQRGKVRGREGGEGCTRGDDKGDKHDHKRPCSLDAVHVPPPASGAPGPAGARLHVTPPRPLGASAMTHRHRWPFCLRFGLVSCCASFQSSSCVPHPIVRSRPDSPHGRRHMRRAAQSLC